MPRGVTPSQRERFSQVLNETGTIEQARLAVGHSPVQARTGKRDLAPAYVSAIEAWEQAKENIALAEKLDKETASNLIKGRLATVVIMGKDADAVNAAHRLGSHRDYNLFAAESQIGVAVYQVSPRLEQLASQLASAELPTIEAELVTPPDNDATPRLSPSHSDEGELGDANSDKTTENGG